MKINGVNLPKSSFLSVEKDLEIVVKHLCKNERLKRLLYYTTKDAIDKPNLNDEQMIQLFNKNIKNTNGILLHIPKTAQWNNM